MPSKRPRKIDCDEHGASLPWMICVHLREGRRRQYHRVEFEPVGENLTAVMCNACAKPLTKEDEWNERLSAFADWKPVLRKMLAPRKAPPQTQAGGLGANQSAVRIA